MKFEVWASQRGTRIEFFRVLESAVTGSPTADSTVLPEGFTRATISEAANNVYTLTFTQPFARAPVAIVMALESGTGVSYIVNNATTSTTAVSWRSENDASAAGAPAGFHIFVIGCDTAEQL